MATNRLFYLNDKLVEPPKNAPATTIKFSYDKDSVRLNNREISITDYEFARENADIILKHYEDGKIFEGLPFRFEIDRAGVTERIFDGYLDIADGAILSCEGCTVKAKERFRIDWLNDTADSVTFEYLASLGKITSANYLYMPYVINPVGNYTQTIITIVSTTTIILQLIEQVNELKKILTHVVNPFEFTFILRAALQVLYIAGLVITLLSLLNDLRKLIIQPVKYHACMRVGDLLSIGASHFGYTLSAEQFTKNSVFENLVILPEKYFNPPLPLDLRILGFTSPSNEQVGYPKTTFGDFLRGIKKAFRAKVIITSDKELIFIREDKQVGAPGYQLPNLYNKTFTTNAEELSSNYLLEFLVDLNDKNTIQEYLGTSYQVITTQKPAVTDIHLNVLKGLETQTIPYALAKRKTELTIPEQIMRDFFESFDGLIGILIDIVNAVIDAIRAIISFINDILDVLYFISIHKIDLGPIGSGPDHIGPFDPAGQIENRIGMLKLENDFVDVPKMFLINVGSESKYNKIAANNSTVVSAKYFWENFHGPAVSFLPSQERPTGNQYIIKEYDNVPFTFNDYEKIKTNNQIFSASGKPAKIESGEWNPYENTAKLKVRISQLYTDKLIEKYIQPDGK